MTMAPRRRKFRPGERFFSVGIRSLATTRNYSNSEQLPAGDWQLPPPVPFDNPYEQLPATLFDIPSERAPIERPRAWKVIFYCY